MKYPFSPEVLDSLPEELAELYRSLEATLLEEICSRLKLSGELNEVTVQDIRALRSHGIDLKGIEKAIQSTANISQRDLQKLLDDVAERNQRYYQEVMDIAGVTAPETLVIWKHLILKCPPTSGLGTRVLAGKTTRHGRAGCTP